MGLSYCMQHGPLKCYSFAITGINITYDVRQWFLTRRVAPFYYKYIHDQQQTMAADDDDEQKTVDANSIAEQVKAAGIDAVHLLYCRAFVNFHQIWAADPPETVMGYSEVHKKFM